LRSALKTTRYLVSSQPDFLAVGELCAKLGISRMTLWRYMRDRAFPKPVQFAGPKSPRHWRLADVEAWERECERRAAS
jgi:predicted DNA-binding transcriptional regulator AlpA